MEGSAERLHSIPRQILSAARPISCTVFESYNPASTDEKLPAQQCLDARLIDDPKM